MKNHFEYDLPGEEDDDAPDGTPVAWTTGLPDTWDDSNMSKYHPNLGHWGAGAAANMPWPYDMSMDAHAQAMAAAAMAGLPGLGPMMPPAMGMAVMPGTGADDAASLEAQAKFFKSMAEMYSQQAAAAKSSRQRGAASSSSIEWTTMAVKNIPNNYKRDQFLAIFGKDFQGRFDMVYLPFDFKTKANKGYAFVNFDSESTALEFKAAYDGFRNWAFPSNKVCEVVWGNENNQGVQQHIERYRNSEVMHESVPEEFKPLLFRLGDGDPVPFPAPTMPIRPPHFFAKGGRKGS